MLTIFNLIGSLFREIIHSDSCFYIMLSFAITKWAWGRKLPTIRSVYNKAGTPYGQIDDQNSLGNKATLFLRISETRRISWLLHLYHVFILCSIHYEKVLGSLLLPIICYEKEPTHLGTQGATLITPQLVSREGGLEEKSFTGCFSDSRLPSVNSLFRLNRSFIYGAAVLSSGHAFILQLLYLILTSSLWHFCFIQKHF